MRTRWSSSRTNIYFVVLYVLTAFCIASGGRTVVAQIGGDGTAVSSNHKQDVSIGDSLRRPGSAPLHILYIHGIGAVGSGDSYVLRKKICDFLKDCTTAEGEIRLPREYADVEDFSLDAPIQPDLTYLGSPIWKTLEQWHAAAPFVDHYVLTRTNGKSILVDELNWWPLTMALKCEHILKEEAQLAGIEPSYLALCTKKTSQATTPGRFNAYDWLDPNADDSLEGRSRAAYLNRNIKIGLMDWGMSDALLAVGPMQGLLIESLRQLLVKCVAASGDEPKALAELVSGDAGLSDSEYIVVSHSLGSFLVFSALNSEMHGTANISSPGNAKTGVLTPRVAGAFTYVLRHTGQAYFFANQVSLLELAMLRSPSQPGPPSTYAIDLAHWGDVRTRAGGSKPQVVAWSDVDDLLSWYLPDIQGVKVVNLNAKNASHWFGLYEGPLAAHDKYASNKTVIGVLLTPKEIDHTTK
jgi:hypothetical protein